MKKFYLFFGILLVLTMTTVLAYDASTPYTVTMQWIVPTETTFSVNLCGSETTIDFDDNVVNGSSKQVQPDCQNTTSSTPMLTITNDGNLAQNFSCNLTTAIQGWAELFVGNSTSIGTASSINVTKVDIVKNVAASANSTIYFWTNLTNADSGTTQRVFEIMSGVA